MTLDQLAIGQTAMILKIHGEGKLRRRLLEMGLITRAYVRMEKRAPSNDPLQIAVRGYLLSLRNQEAQMVEVAVPYE